jgi:hypothetical protein
VRFAGRRAGLALGAFSVLFLGASPPPPRPDFERALVVTEPGKVSIVLDRHVYEGARPDLADLRVLDQTGTQVPYLLEEPWSGPEVTLKQPRSTFNRGFKGEESATLTLNFGEPLLKTGLVLSLSGDNFRRRVMVEGRNKHEPWTTLTDVAYVFAIPPPSAARYESVRLPENNYQYLRVTVFRGPDDVPRIEILDTWAGCEERRRPKEVPVAPLQQTTSEDAERRETHLTIDLGARHQPFRGLVLDVADESFFRGVVLEARRDPGRPMPGGPPPSVTWARLGEGSLYRYQNVARSERRASAAIKGASIPAEKLEDAPVVTSEQLRIDVAGRERVLRLRIANRDDRPLEIRGVTVMAPVERLVFTADAGRSYRLTYGAPNLARPEYDIQRTVRDPAVWIAQGREGKLGPPVRTPIVAETVPWTERHKSILWGGLVIVVLLLGGVTWRALKAV